MVLAVLGTTFLPAAPASATYGAQFPVNVQVSGLGQLRGEIHGWIQFDDGKNLFRYDFIFCRDSSFVAPRFEIRVNNTLYGSRFHGDYGPTPSSLCSFPVHVAEEINYGSPACSVQFVVIGSSFDQNVFREHRSTNGTAIGTTINPFC
jgi:hypothetical protein